MTDLFPMALAHVLRNEGGYVNHPKDPGGATNYGISLRFVKSELGVDTDGDGFADGDFDRDGDIDINDIKNLTKEQASWAYRTQFWDRMSCNVITDLPLATKVFDAGVNMGRPWGIRLLQRSLRATGWNKIVDDGVFGTLTRSALEQDLRYHREGELLVAYRCEQASRYRELVAANNDLAVFLRGWLRRAYDEV